MVESPTTRTCNGYSSITFRGYNTNNFQWESIVAPPGVHISNGVSSSGNNPSWTVANVPLGYYVFRITTTCGDEMYDTVDVKTAYTAFNMDYSYRFECSNSNIQIYNYTTNMGRYAFSLLDMNDNTIRGGSLSSYLISSSGLVAGSQYKLRVWATSYPCEIREKVISMPQLANSLNLTNNITFNECRNTSNEGALIVRPGGGFPPYTYYLYEDTLLSANRVIGPVSSNIFTNLNANKRHVVQVSDQCGRGSNISLRFGQAALQLLNNAGGSMPCIGDTLAMSLLPHPEFTYQWQRNNENIVGATSNSYAINNIQAEDDGIYQLSYNVGACQVLTKSFTLVTELCEQSLLPVEMTKFEVYPNQNSVHVKWSTASEKVNSGFEIYNSTDGKNWQRIGFHASKSLDGNSSIPLDYSFTHTTPSSGVNYYQLKQIDFDGTYSLSEIVQAHILSEKNSISVYPNPAINQIQLDGLPTQNKVLFTNSLGKTVEILDNVENQSAISVKGMSKGTYTITVFTSGSEILQNLKLIVQ